MKFTLKTCSLIGMLMGALLPISANAAALNGAELSLLWALPFAGILLCIALGPLFFTHIWHHHYGKISVAWAMVCAIPLLVIYGLDLAGSALAHAILGDYIPFIIFVGSLFVVAGGIHIRSSFTGTPLLNAGILLIGAFLANLMGTTGAAMLLIRPLIKANENRRYRIHTFIFFIFLVANIGGCLTPLGDPPLFLGFLRGVDFFWTFQHLIAPMFVITAILLALYLVLDTYFYKKEEIKAVVKTETVPFAIEGKINFLFLAIIIGAVLMSGMWKSGISYEFAGVHFKLQDLCRDGILILMGISSLLFTPAAARKANEFSWDPIVEVGKLFFGIFTCIVPVLEMLRAGHAGAFAPLVALVSNPDGSLNNYMFFWLTGSLSSFLDNAPTYLAFFNLAGGDVDFLMNEGAHTLMSISMGAVFMGAMSYIGNAPNFMTVSIVQERGIQMPSFFGYMIWSICILVPVFFLINIMFL